MTFAPGATTPEMPSIDRFDPPRQSATTPIPCGTCATGQCCLVGKLPQAAQELGPFVRERRFRQGEKLSGEGELSAHFRIVRTGMVFLGRRNSHGISRPVAISGRGAAFGICSYLAQPNQVSVTAAVSGRCCEIETDRILVRVRHDQAFREQVGKCLVDAVSTLAQWAEVIGHRTVVAQVANVLRLLAATQGGTSVSLPSQTALAEMLGTTRESVARALAALEAADCLRKSSVRCYEIRPQPLAPWLSGHALPDSSQGVRAKPAAKAPGCNNPAEDTLGQ